METGRNDPCHCGSGKKYKKCCLDKDQAAAHAALVPPKAPEKTRPVTLDDGPELDFGKLFQEAIGEVFPPMEIDAMDERLEAFAALDYEGQIALFARLLEEEAPMDADMAFEMLDKIHQHGIQQGNDGRVLALLDALREHAPDVYATDAAYYLHWRIGHALAADQASALPALGAELAATATLDIDIFNRIADQLAYHGQLPILAEAMRTAWPKVKESRKIMSWGIGEFAGLAANYEIFQALEQGLPMEGDQAELRERLEVYDAVDGKEVARYTAHLTGTAQTAWTPEDFAFLARRSKTEDRDGEDRLFYLSAEFIGYLWREEGVALTKGRLASGQIQEYLLGRREEEHDSREHGTKVKRPALPGLCPDFATLDRYLGTLLNPLSMLFYKAVAILELLPAWLRFLETRGLVGAEQREQALDGCRELAESLFKFCSAQASDPALAEGLRQSGLISE